ncbi:MAG: bacteriocin immunity protein [Sporolactobacillus sp.]
MATNKKLSRKEKEEAILARVYDLILDEEIQEDERSVFIAFKNDVGAGKDFERYLMYLAESLRQIAVSRLKDQTKLSPQVGEFYLEISDTGLRSRNLANGIASSAITFH